MVYVSRSVLGRDLKVVHDELGCDLALSPTGDLELVEDELNLSQAVINRLRTRLGELTELGHPDYGSRLHELIGEPNNERTRSLVKLYVAESVARDPRVQEVVEVSVQASKEDPSRIDVSITILPTGSSRLLNIVFPFYLEVF
ncbi:MAG: hypothetical protein DRJ68_02345 [Thermoprotei archaeon]|nr:MAG: hypothetical protein DRJ62_04575 [Thermoprotei archaeon]RLF21955.1 MAG: hypothetical protein DRJ68_02345 [Thermoprotei archaeon]